MRSPSVIPCLYFDRIMRINFAAFADLNSAKRRLSKTVPDIEKKEQISYAAYVHKTYYNPKPIQPAYKGRYVAEHALDCTEVTFIRATARSIAFFESN